MQTDQNNYPQICISAGLTCEICAEETARQLARCCKGLRGKTIGQLFVQIHSHPACAPMHAHFAQCYRRAAGEPANYIKPAALAAAASA